MNYKDAGVDICASNEVVQRIKKPVESTFSKNVLTEIGAFGSLYDLKALLNQYQHPVLVQSMDGVGTKTIIARMMDKFDTIGVDVVNAVMNDIVVLGARPLTFLDYIASDKLRPHVIEQIISGMVTACSENEVSLVGGEISEMPGKYLPNQHDVVGVVTGIVEKEKAILGKTILPGDVVLGLASNGLHTNGYSLARKLFFDKMQWEIDHYLPELNMTLGETLLVPHLSYARPILNLLENQVEIKGMAHITGGGFLENIPRILPEHCHVEIKKEAWPKLPIFNLIQALSGLDDNEMYCTFNMGIGLVLIVNEREADKIQQYFRNFGYKLYNIGRVVHKLKGISIC